VVESAASPRAQGELACETGIFGVPNFVARGEIFLGADRLDCWYGDYANDLGTCRSGVIRTR
jgi:2-hydroxychromene-2-carboxylate isomerase